MDTDNKIIAAHLAAAVIAKSEMHPFTPQMAVQRFNAIYDILEAEKAERDSKGIDQFVKSAIA